MGWFKSLLSAIKTIATIVTATEAAAKAVKKLDEIIKTWAPALRDWWNGKKIAVVGPTAAGKNSLYNRLRGLPIPMEHAQTRGAENVEKFTLTFPLPNHQKFKIFCKGALNVGGERDERDRYWLGACEGADVVFYLLDFNDLKANRFHAGTRIHDDLMWLAAHIPKMSSTVRVHILVNKIDLICTPGRTYDDIATDLQPAVQELEKIANGVFGSYKNRLTGITPTSMMSDHLFAISFGLALQEVQKAASL